MNKDSYVERAMRIGELAGESEEYKMLDWYMSQPFIIYLPNVALMLDNPSAAILLGRLWFWSNTPTAKERGGWFWWELEQITKETGLGPKRIRNARETLEARCILQTETKGAPRRIWWHVDKAEYFRQLRLFIDSLEDSKSDS